MNNDTSTIKCSFCGKNRRQVEQIIEGPDFFGHNLYICNECVDVTYNILHTHDEELPKVRGRREKILSPEKIKTYLDEYIIGQDDAKVTIAVAIYNHYKRIFNKTKTVIDKSNLLMIGPSGSGKTLTIKTIAKLFDIPYVMADATSLTEVGYVGNDVESVLKRLLKEAGDDLEKAQHGIVFIDEIDKKIKKTESMVNSRDISG